MAFKLFKRKNNSEMYYDPTDIDNTGALYRLIIGQRSNGKTYSYIKKVIEEYFKSGLPSAYVRRYAEEIRPKYLSELLTVHKELILKLSKGQYNSATYRNNQFTLCYVDEETGNVIKKADTPILFTLAVNTWLTAKGQDRGELAYICYDEFMTRDLYLKDEFVDFSNILSSLIRDRKVIAIYMLANTVNKYCPYFVEMGLKNIDEMKQGDIYLYKYNNEKLTVAVEYCLTAENTKNVAEYYAFENEQLKMITSGEWEIAQYQRLERTDFCPNEKTLKFKFLVDFNEKKIVGEVHHEGDITIVYFHPLGNSKYNWGLRDVIYTDKEIISPRHSHSFMVAPTQAHTIIKNLITQGLDYYSDNQTGEVIRNFKLFGMMK